MESAVKNGRIYEFDEFRLIPGEQLLLRNGEPISLNRKSFRVLTMLVERHGHLVLKSEILDSVWEDSFVEEGSLPKAVWHVRQALGDASKERFVKTVLGSGYRFIAPVSVITEGSGAFRLADVPGIDNDVSFNEVEPSANGAAGIGSVDALHVERAEEKIDSGHLPSRQSIIFGVAVGIAVIALVLGYYGFVLKGSARPLHTIAVLPITPLNSDERNNLFDVGIADSIINRLASSEELKVRPLNSVRSYSGKTVDPIAIGREQKADYVLESNYQIAGGRIKITAQLYNVASGNVEDTFRSEQPLTNIFGAQDAIAADFGSRLLARFGLRPGASRPKRGTNNEEAYKLYHQAMYLIDKRSPENSRRARGYLEQAVGLDPNYAQAWAAMATAARNSGGNDNAEIHRTMIESINKALAIDPDLSDAYTALCIDKLLYEYDFAGAENACELAIRLDSNSAAAHRTYSWVLKFQGRFDEALSEIGTAIDLEPTSYVSKRDYGNILHLSRRWDDAAAHFKRLLEIEPNDPVLYNQLIRIFEGQGKEAEAYEYLIKLLSVLKRDDQTRARYQTAYQTSGWRGVLLERAKDPDPGFPFGNNFFIAGLYARLGEKDKAFELLETALKDREWAMPMLQVSPQFDPIRDDPRYKDLVQRIEHH